MPRVRAQASDAVGASHADVFRSSINGRPEGGTDVVATCAKRYVSGGSRVCEAACGDPASKGPRLYGQDVRAGSP